MDTAILIFLLALAAFMAARLCRVWFKYRGDRVVTCPETHQTVGVALDVKHAAWTGLSHPPGLRLETCTRWPERQDCGQECLRQIEASPENCLVRTILTQWYQGKDCAICNNPIGEIHWADHRPGSAESRTAHRGMGPGAAGNHPRGIADAPARLLELPHRPDILPGAPRDGGGSRTICAHVDMSNTRVISRAYPPRQEVYYLIVNGPKLHIGNGRSITR